MKTQNDYTKLFELTFGTPVITVKTTEKSGALTPEVLEKHCKSCDSIKSIDLFVAGLKEYKHCNDCRAQAIAEKDSRVRSWIQKEGYSLVIQNVPLARCQRCGRTNPIELDFPVSLSSPTGYGVYCLPKCKGKKS